MGLRLKGSMSILSEPVIVGPDRVFTRREAHYQRLPRV